MEIITKSIRKILSDKTDSFTFYRCDDSNFVLNPNKGFGLYLHIPFCRSLCPYCPYSKIPYDKDLANKYVEAVCHEMRWTAQRIGKQKFESLYIGGGTPTLLASGLKRIVTEIKNHFVFEGPVAIESTPSDFNKNRVKDIKEIGVDLISLGVQSFQQKYLSLLGRNHTASMTEQAVSLLQKKNFRIANLDLIFALPGQSTSELMDDLEKAISFQPEQITYYPLFTFPYSKVGRFLRLTKVQMPNWRIRRKMYYLITDFFARHGYHQSSVWSFNRNQNGKYSSVTRDYYIGFGAGAASYTGNAFYFNTFSIPEYIKASARRTQAALKMNVSKKLEKLFWLYWRFYDTQIPLGEYERLFDRNIWDDFGKELHIAKSLGFFKNGNSKCVTLNKRGAFWIHLLQNQFALNYVNTIWTKCQNESWPLKVSI